MIFYPIVMMYIYMYIMIFYPSDDVYFVYSLNKIIGYMNSTPAMMYNI